MAQQLQNDSASLDLAVNRTIINELKSNRDKRIWRETKAKLNADLTALDITPRTEIERWRLSCAVSILADPEETVNAVRSGLKQLDTEML